MQPLGISRSAFYRAVDTLPPRKTARAPTALLQQLKKCTAITPKAAVCDLVSLATAARLLQALHVPKTVVDSLLHKHPAVCLEDSSSWDGSSSTSDPSSTDDEASASGQQHEEGDDEEMPDDDGSSSSSSISSSSSSSSGHSTSSDSVQEGSSSDEASQGGGDDAEAAGPAAVPADSVQLQGRYGLTSIKSSKEKHACISHIRLQMADLQEWSQSLFQPGRPQQLRQMGKASWDTHRQRVHEYLGYLYHYQQVSRPSLHAYLNQQHFTAFMAFLTARGVDKGGHTKAVAAAVRVVSWLKSQPLLAADQRATAKAMLRWLKAMGAQLGQNMVPRPKCREPEELKEQGRWMDAAELVARVEGVRLQALAMVASMEEGNTPKLDAAKAVHDALLATMCFGYMPPLRDNSVLLTITAPPFKGCMHPDCQHQATGCRGNRVHPHPVSGRWLLDIHHHKNTRVWHGKAIKIKLPVEVAELLQHHLTWAKAQLTGMHDEQVPPTLFVNTSTGAPLKPQEVAKVWSKTVLQGSGVHFGPHLCRSIFVVGNRDRGLPDSPGMAMLMGNSQAVWDSVYDRHFNNRQADAAMHAMQDWRAGMLSEFTGQQQAAAAAAGGGGAPNC